VLAHGFAFLPLQRAQPSSPLIHDLLGRRSDCPKTQSSRESLAVIEARLHE
jgi:hypothetical protein